MCIRIKLMYCKGGKSKVAPLKISALTRLFDFKKKTSLVNKNIADGIRLCANTKQILLGKEAFANFNNITDHGILTKVQYVLSYRFRMEADNAEELVVSYFPLNIILVW